MMMPANYSAIAENEMTYVVGGASFIDAIGAVTAPIWTVDNVKTFSTNVVTLIGNKFLNSTIDKTLGVLFSGNATWKQVGAIPKTLFTSKSGDLGDNIANALGVAAAVYNLGTATVANAASSAAIGKTFGEGKTGYFTADGTLVGYTKAY